ITYIGPVNDRQKNELLGQASALLMPIQWNEPFGIVMAEAMACGTPVLGFPLGSVPEIVFDGINGFVCRDTDEMAGRTKDLATLDRKKIRELAEERFSDTKIAADYMVLYTSLINRRKDL
ncbi:MAG: glycosyltransferase, partial [Bacteroidota bacterium]